MGNIYIYILADPQIVGEVKEEDIYTFVYIQSMA